MHATRLRSHIARLAVLTAALSIAGFGSVASAHYNFPNSDGDSNCRGQTDPINILVEGTFALAGNVHILIDARVGWGDNLTGASDGYVRQHGQCLAQNRQNKLGNIEGHHTRLWEGTDLGPNARYYTVGDAHRESANSSFDCVGDAVYYRINGRSGYDEGAHEIYRGSNGKGGLGGGYFSRKIRRPHTFKYHQCNSNPKRTRVGWNGRQLVFHYNTGDPN